MTEDSADDTAVKPPLPKGVVLGKDGKPCRSCSDRKSFMAWAAATTKVPGNTQRGVHEITTAQVPKSTHAAPPGPSYSQNDYGVQRQQQVMLDEIAAADDCPPDVEALGRGSWPLLHSIAAQYPERPTAGEQRQVRDFMRLFATLYPCWVCGDGFARFQATRPVPTGSRSALGNWLCDAHNEVNRRLGKPEFDCSRWEERWRTGWKDGRCG